MMIVSVTIFAIACARANVAMQSAFVGSVGLHPAVVYKRSAEKRLSGFGATDNEGSRQSVT